MICENIFELHAVSRRFSVRHGIFRRGPEFKALERISLTLRRGVFTGLVGESGSGKTTLARLLAGLLTPSEGEILFEGKSLTQYLPRHSRQYWKKVQMVFQNPYLTLDPKWRIREIIEEGIRELGRRERNRRVESALANVHLSRDYLGRFPHELSGGERQRVAIARAIVLSPEFLILDEPTSQLDVSIQAQMIKLLKELTPVFSGGILFITHDLALVSYLVDEIIVLGEGKIVEQGERSKVLKTPEAEYTRRLLSAVIPWD
ncbi:MAG: ABC transporter ATP-binding protein [Candidatus Omnitrophica bacterium]|nr:ABC transporter ATP-binding protein [Candidatus Omnitrophota bacterium]